MDQSREGPSSSESIQGPKDPSTGPSSGIDSHSSSSKAVSVSVLYEALYAAFLHAGLSNHESIETATKHVLFQAQALSQNVIKNLMEMFDSLKKSNCLIDNDLLGWEKFVDHKKKPCAKTSSNTITPICKMYTIQSLIDTIQREYVELHNRVVNNLGLFSYSEMTGTKRLCADKVIEGYILQYSDQKAKNEVDISSLTKVAEDCQAMEHSSSKHQMEQAGEGQANVCNSYIKRANILLWKAARGYDMESKELKERIENDNRVLLWPNQKFARYRDAISNVSKALKTYQEVNKNFAKEVKQLQELQNVNINIES
eukprot:Nk52_evm1s313 gene=Nk52_evmTU1s313